MYINPQTDIRLLHNAPMDASYVHSLYFASASNQSSYFMGLTKYNLNHYTYQRYDKGVLRVQILADNLYDINYMMFRNTAFGSKWFYAFVDKVEYINDITTAIYYHIDEIQTWLFDWNFAECFVERMHTPTDEIGDNIIPEPVEVGEYIYNNYERINYLETARGTNTSPYIMVGIAKVDDNAQYITDGNIYDGVYGALTLYAFTSDNNGKAGADFLISYYSNKDPDTVVTVYMIPHDALWIGAPVNSSDGGGNIENITPLNANDMGASTTINLGNAGTSIDGYTPKNKKLFTYPFNFENVVNGEGGNLALRYEFFNNNDADTTTPMTAKIFAYSTATQPVQSVCFPIGYKGVPKGSNNRYMVDEKLTLSSYPACSWNADAWKVWWGQNAVPVAIKAVESAVAIGVSSYHPASAGKEVGTGITDPNTGKEITKTEGAKEAGFELDKVGGLYALHNVSNLLTSMYKASIQADYCKGNISSANAMFSQGDYGFKHGRMSVNSQQAQVIDSFFDKYGYAINKTITPSLHTRVNWTYIKTADCTIHGSIPRDSEAIIENAFNNGITFWARPSIVNVGDYSQNNAPL